MKIRIAVKSYFRKAGHAYGMTKKKEFLVNLGQFEDGFPLKKHGNLKFWECENTEQNSTRTLRAGTTGNKCQNKT